MKFLMKSLLLIIITSMIFGCQNKEAAKPGGSEEETIQMSTTAISIETEISPTVTDTPPSSTSTSTEIPIKEMEGLYLVDNYDPGRNPYLDLADALAIADGSGKRVLLEVGGDWCPDCVLLGSFIENNKDIYAEMARQYIVVKVNISPENMNEEFLSQYPDFEWVPNFIILDKDGSFIKSLDTRELMTDGKFDTEKFWEFLNYLG